VIRPAMPLEFRDKGTSGTQIAFMSGEVTIAALWKGVLSVTAGYGAAATRHPSDYRLARASRAAPEAGGACNPGGASHRKGR
jgi:hypothetical protein